MTRPGGQSAGTDRKAGGCHQNTDSELTAEESRVLPVIQNLIDPLQGGDNFKCTRQVGQYGHDRLRQDPRRNGCGGCASDCGQQEEKYG
ncbi:MAG TPA: hypothetical protein DC058_24350 [Planctomycetaceae bacterium]|nr:hypothetical protein [Planctomycetaceae bacterium]